MRTAEDGRRLSMLRWGLIPYWSREPNIGFRMINARAETAAVKPAFREAYRARRCLIPLDAFDSWARRPADRPRPLSRQSDDEPDGLDLGEQGVQ